MVGITCTSEGLATTPSRSKKAQNGVGRKANDQSAKGRRGRSQPNALAQLQGQLALLQGNARRAQSLHGAAMAAVAMGTVVAHGLDDDDPAAEWAALE